MAALMPATAKAATCVETTAQSGKPGTLLCRAPLGTGLATFTASGSSKPDGFGGVRPYDPLSVEWVVRGSVHRDRGRGV